MKIIIGWSVYTISAWRLINLTYHGYMTSPSWVAQPRHRLGLKNQCLSYRFCNAEELSRILSTYRAITSISTLTCEPGTSSPSVVT
jgi:hypothetical protein